MSFGCIPIIIGIILAALSKTDDPFRGKRETAMAYTILITIFISLMISIILFLVLLF